MIVIDASAAIEVLLPTALGQKLSAQIRDEDVHAPHLIDIEVLSILRRLSFAGILQPETATRARSAMLAWTLERHGHLPLIERIWQLRNAVSSYDATYIALAETLGAPLYTRDGRLSRSHDHRAEVILVS